MQLTRYVHPVPPAGARAVRQAYHRYALQQGATADPAREGGARSPGMRGGGPAGRCAACTCPRARCLGCLLRVLGASRCHSRRAFMR
jgi:hypothetical protein